jgi:hypothetical protein
LRYGYKQGINDDQLCYARYCVLTYNERFHSIRRRQLDDYRNYLRLLKEFDAVMLY